MLFKLLPEDKAIAGYVARLTQCAAAIKMSAIDIERAAAHQKALD